MKTTKEEAYFSVLGKLGGDTTLAEWAQECERLNLFPSGEQGAVKKWYQNDIRRTFNAFRRGKRPKAIAYERCYVGDDGESVHVQRWVQTTMLTVEQWWSNVERREIGIKADIEKRNIMLELGIELFGDAAREKIVQSQIDFDVDGVLKSS